MRIAVPKETTAGETRVALIPDGTGRLVKAGHEVVVERDAGAAAGFADAAYAASGATLAAGADLFAGAAVVAAVQAAGLPLDRLPQGAAVIGFLDSTDRALLDRFAARGLTAFAMELVPRTTRAQSMDALSSQATVAGYKAVLIGAAALPRFLPMLTTAAGTVPPARVFVVGAGVAGLQAIATARRLGAIVSAFDVRPVVKEQVQSLGATFVEAAVSADAEAAGGYARELAADQQRLVADAVAAHIRDMDLVVTTAQIPGRPAPRIVTEAMVRGMKPGSVIVDLAAESGGNCELTRAGETVRAHGVTILGPVDLATSLPFHASQMYSRNVQSFIEYAVKDGALAVDLADPIVGPTCVVHGGAVRGENRNA